MAKYSQKNYKIISDTFNCDEDLETCKANMIKKEIKAIPTADFQYFFTQQCGVPPEKSTILAPAGGHKAQTCIKWDSYKIKGGDRSYVPSTAAIPEKPLVIKSTQPKILEKPLVIKSTQPKIPEILSVKPLPVQQSKLPTQQQPLSSTVRLQPFVQSLPVQTSSKSMRLQPDENVEFNINFLKTIQLNTDNEQLQKKFRKIQKKLNKLATKIEQKNISDISFSVPVSSVKSSSSSIQKQPIPFLSNQEKSPYTSISEKAGSPAKIPFDRVPSLVVSEESEASEAVSEESEKAESEASEESEAESEVSEAESEVSEAESEVSEAESEVSEASVDIIDELNTQKNNLNIILKKIYTHSGSEVLIDDITNVFDINNFDDKSANHIHDKIKNCIELIKVYEGGGYNFLPYSNYIHSLDKQKKLFEQNKLNIYKILENVQTTNSIIEKQLIAEEENELYHYLNRIYGELKRNNFFLNNEQFIDIENLDEYKILKQINERIKKILVDNENKAVESHIESVVKKPEPQSVKQSRRVSVENIEDIIQDISMEEDGDEIKKDILKCLNV